MHTITALARKSGLPRRSVQYWHDQKILKPLSVDPLVYSEDELKMVRLLAPFGRMPMQIGTIRELVRIFRLIMANDDSVPDSVAKAFQAAERHDPAYFIVAPALLSDGDSIWLWTEGATTETGATNAVIRILQRDPLLAVVIVDASFALNTKMGAGTLYFEENAE